ncbi:recombinase family protein [Klebsiella quasipneumoniae subsp. similipneumoniae]
MWSGSRIALCSVQTHHLVSELQDRGIHFQPTDSIDTSTPAGRFSSTSERPGGNGARAIVERTRAGLAAARGAGRVGGRRRQ